MRLALLTDIHGNAPALQAVLQEIDTQAIDEIVCLGDMIAIGPYTNEVLDILFSLDNLSIVTGNHDEAVLALLTDESLYPKSHIHAHPHHEWVADSLHPKFIKKLQRLPRVIQKTENTKSLKFLHYALHEERKTDPISVDPFLPIVEPNLENMTQLFQNHNDSLIAFGHHHPTHFFKNNNTIYLNPGSLGCHPYSVARYCVLTVTKNNIHIELKEVTYNREPLFKAYADRKVVQRDLLIEIFHG